MRFKLTCWGFSRARHQLFVVKEATKSPILISYRSANRQFTIHNSQFQVRIRISIQAIEKFFFFTFNMLNENTCPCIWFRLMFAYTMKDERWKMDMKVPFGLDSSSEWPEKTLKKRTCLWNDDLWTISSTNIT